MVYKSESSNVSYQILCSVSYQKNNVSAVYVAICTSPLLTVEATKPELKEGVSWALRSQIYKAYINTQNVISLKTYVASAA